MSRQPHDGSDFVRHEPCPSCGSRNNLGRFSDGHGYCFGCKRYEKGEGGGVAEEEMAERQALARPLHEGEYVSLEKRALREESLRKYDYRTGQLHGRPAHFATYYDTKGRPVAQKVRLPGKQFVWVGEPKHVGLWGQQLWSAGGKKLVITEGEIDAMSVSQVQNHRWPVVSVPNGAQGAAKAIQAQLEWVDSFDQIVFMFDQDLAGRAAAAECAELLTPGKARIAELPRKDPNEMLVAGEERELIQGMWQAKVYRPDGIVAGEDLWELVSTAEPVAPLTLPWDGLQQKLRGLRRGKLYTFCAGTGMGKSTACRELAYHLLQCEESVGYIALEEGKRDCALAMMALHMNRPFPDVLDELPPEEELRVAFEATVGSGRWYQYDHWGSMESEHLMRKVRQLARGFGVGWIVLDHVSIVISGNETANERKDLDVLMTRLRSLAEELNVSILLVSHLNRKDGLGHENGAQVSLRDLRGSQAIAQLSDAVIALERDQQEADHANVSLVRLLKNRLTGETGKAGYLHYDRGTGRLKDCDDPFAISESGDSAGGDGSDF